MTAEVIRDALTASPFVPFVLRLADGRTFQVDHPLARTGPRRRARGQSDARESRHQMTDPPKANGLECRWLAAARVAVRESHLFHHSCLADDG
jgi:hypothetical protein